MSRYEYITRFRKNSSEGIGVSLEQDLISQESHLRDEIDDIAEEIKLLHKLMDRRFNELGEVEKMLGNIRCAKSMEGF